MRAIVWGCRGSVAAPGPSTARYGGNTACVELRLDGGAIILDAGTGIRALGHRLQQEGVTRVNLLLTHHHMDHLVGLGFFAPLHAGGVEIHVWGPGTRRCPLAQRIEKYLSPPLFPVRLSEVASRMTFHDLPSGPWSIAGARVVAERVSHTGHTVGYRIEEAGQSLAYIPDHEPALGVDLRRQRPERISGFGLAERADVLLHDAQYTAGEYATRTGWGHSSVDDLVVLAHRAAVRRLVLFHHDPAHSDSDLEAMEAHARRLWGPSGEAPQLAREGMEIDVASAAAPPP